MKLKVKADDLDHIEEVISHMDFKPGYGYDFWYPTKDELDRFLKKKLPGQKDKELAAFLIWLTKTSLLKEEGGSNEETEKVRKRIMDILAGDGVLEIEQDPNDLYYPNGYKKKNTMPANADIQRNDKKGTAENL